MRIYKLRNEKLNDFASLKSYQFYPGEDLDRVLKLHYREKYDFRDRFQLENSVGFEHCDRTRG